jgi:hypothetical protein
LANPKLACIGLFCINNIIIIIIIINFSCDFKLFYVSITGTSWFFKTHTYCTIKNNSDIRDSHVRDNLINPNNHKHRDTTVCAILIVFGRIPHAINHIVRAPNKLPCHVQLTRFVSMYLPPLSLSKHFASIDAVQGEGVTLQGEGVTIG